MVAGLWGLFRIEHWGIEKMREIRIEKSLVAAVVRWEVRKFLNHIVKQGGVRGNLHDAGVKMTWIDEGCAEVATRKKWREIVEDKGISINENEALVLGHVKYVEFCHDGAESGLILWIVGVWGCHLRNFKNSNTVVNKLLLGSRGGLAGYNDDTIS